MHTRLARVYSDRMLVDLMLSVRWRGQGTRQGDRTRITVHAMSTRRPCGTPLEVWAFHLTLPRFSERQLCATVISGSHESRCVFHTSSQAAQEHRPAGCGRTCSVQPGKCAGHGSPLEQSKDKTDRMAILVTQKRNNIPLKISPWPNFLFENFSTLWLGLTVVLFFLCVPDRFSFVYLSRIC